MTAKTSTKTSPKATKKPAKGKSAKKLSALDAAARVLAEMGGAMTTQELIEAMAAKKLWESPAGKTPAATLYAALSREITTKGKGSRFKKTQPGQFATTGKYEPAETPVARSTKKKSAGKAPGEPTAGAGSVSV
jgi:hypothetical protein